VENGVNCAAIPAPCSTAKSTSTPAAGTDGHLGHQPGSGGADRRAGAGPASIDDPILRQDMRRALHYMGLEPGMALRDIVISHALSAPAPTRGSKICVTPPASCVGGGWPGMCGR
jgi:hypothetical protein